MLFRDRDPGWDRLTEPCVGIQFHLRVGHRITLLQLLHLRGLGTRASGRIRDHCAVAVDGRTLEMTVAIALRSRRCRTDGIVLRMERLWSRRMGLFACLASCKSRLDVKLQLVVVQVLRSSLELGV